MGQPGGRAGVVTPRGGSNPTLVTDTDPDRPGERLAKQLREAFRIKNHLNPANYRFKVGTSVHHQKHGKGKVLELMVDGRTRVLFDSGIEHR